MYVENSATGQLSKDASKAVSGGQAFLLLFSLWLFLAEETAVAQSVEFLPAGPQVDAESCRFEAPASSLCAAPNGDEVLIHFPESLERAIQAHVRAAKAAGYFDELSVEDLFHGHALLVTDSTAFVTPADYFSRIRAFVYHSAEYNNRWRSGDRRPRSFVGWIDEGRPVQPAIDLIPKSFRLRDYQRSGAVNQDEIGKTHPELSSLKYDDWGRPPSLTIDLSSEGHRICFLEDIFYIVPEPNERLDIYVRCAFAPPNGILEYKMVQRPGVALNWGAAWNCCQ